MKNSQLKGALLEFLVRNLMKNCGFNSVVADNLYTFENLGLFFVNGKGAAHDADVLMEPPIQIPFTYPYRVLFECKAYGSTVGLPVVRSALGLRYDINEFEIVTKDSVMQRQNNRRASYAVEARNRYNYQIAVASRGDFSKPAVEFAANNKIPLLSMKSLLPPQTLSVFASIDQTYVDTIAEETQDRLYRLFKDRQHGLDANGHTEARAYLRNDPKIGKVISDFREVLDRLFVGLIETGDLIFLYAETDALGWLRETRNLTELRVQIHYYLDQPDVWWLQVFDSVDRNLSAQFRFFLPEMIVRLWKQYGLERSRAIDIKAEFFSRIFIFTNRAAQGWPFLTLRLDQRWLDELILNRP